MDPKEISPQALARRLPSDWVGVSVFYRNAQRSCYCAYHKVTGTELYCDAYGDFFVVRGFRRGRRFPTPEAAITHWELTHG